jgi:segregation and condensation protein A
MLLHEQLDYTVQLPAFEGPLDLLLRLIEREELDITSIALAQVADQYLATVRGMETPDPAQLSAFLVMAARLLQIKSRALLPRPPTNRGPDEPIDEAEELVRQLREYQRFKQAAVLLRTFQDEGRRMFTRQAPPPLPVFERPDKLDVTLGEMLAAVQRRLQLMLPLEEPEVPLPAPKIITVPEMAARIRDRLRQQPWFDFEDLLSLAAQRVEIIVAFWAVLELWKRRVIVVEQHELFGPLAIGRGPQIDAPISLLGESEE